MKETVTVLYLTIDSEDIASKLVGSTVAIINFPSIELIKRFYDGILYNYEVVYRGR